MAHNAMSSRDVRRHGDRLAGLWGGPPGLLLLPLVEARPPPDPAVRPRRSLRVMSLAVAGRILERGPALTEPGPGRPGRLSGWLAHSSLAEGGRRCHRIFLIRRHNVCEARRGRGGLYLALNG